MKKAWNDIKSFVTVLTTIGFIVFTFMGLISGDKYFEIFIMIISFYFGTQYQKNADKKSDEEERG